MKALKIKTIEPASPGQWDETLDSCPYATFFHSRQWSEIWHRYSKGKMQPSPLVIRFNDGRSAILPLTLVRAMNGILKINLSSPGGTYGGWISGEGLATGHGNLLSDLLLEKGRIIWRINPFDPLAEQNTHSGNVEIDTTHALDLTDGMEQLYKRWSKGHRSAVTKSRREGVTVSLAEDLDDWMDYYSVYQDSIRRWGKKATSVYRPGLFQDLFHLDSDAIKLWLAHHEGKCVAGALCFYTNRHVAYWHGATLGEAFKLRPANFLLYEAIKDAAAKGYHWFDFNPSGGHEGVRAFKKSFATQELPCPIISKGAGNVLTLNRWLKKARALIRS